MRLQAGAEHLAHPFNVIGCIAAATGFYASPPARWHLPNWHTDIVCLLTYPLARTGTEMSIYRQHGFSSKQSSLKKRTDAISGTMGTREAISFVPEAAAGQGAQLAPPSAWGRLS